MTAIEDSSKEESFG